MVSPYSCEPSNEEIVTCLIAATNRSKRVIDAITACAVGGVIRLRAHERGLEGHDDVMVIYREELTKEIERNFAKTMTFIESGKAEEYLRAPRGAFAPPCGRGLKRLATRYTPAFKVSKLAPALMLCLSESISRFIRFNAVQLLALLYISCYAQRHGLIDGEANPGTFITEQATAWRKAAEEVADTMFERGYEALDGVAKAENKFYTHLLAEGCDADTALERTHKRFSESARPILFPESGKKAGAA